MPQQLTQIALGSWAARHPNHSATEPHISFIPRKLTSVGQN